MTNNQVIQNFTLAARCMVKAAMEELKAKAPQAYADVTRAAGAGAFFDVGCAISPAGLLESRVELVTPSERINLARVEYGDPTLN